MRRRRAATEAAKAALDSSGQTTTGNVHTSAPVRQNSPPPGAVFAHSPDGRRGVRAPDPEGVRGPAILLTAHGGACTLVIIK